MHEFNIYIEINKHGLIDEAQKEQLRLVFNCLQGRYINLLWQCTGNQLSFRQVKNTLRNINSLCNKKNVTIHNEFNTKGKKVPFIAHWIIKKLSIELYEDKRILKNDFISMYYGNEPKGCAFSSCLGKTIYIKKNGNISICPYGEDILLVPLKDGGKITDMFEIEGFKSLLRKHIQKRNVCKATCQKYDLCHGSCPLRDDNWESCEIIENITEEGLKCSDKDKLEQKISRLATLYKG